MKKNRKDSFNNLLLSRADMMDRLFGDGAPTPTILTRLQDLRGIKKYFFTNQYLVENDMNGENRDILRQEFEYNMVLWMDDKVSSTLLEQRATQLINDSIKQLTNGI
jgi:hypothetical protein